MPLPKPNLDDRTFQQLVDEAKRMIPRYCPEWTDHNVSDPGVTLIELFAWMVESMLYQINRIPEKTYITLLELLGVTLRAPEAASTMLTFRLSAPLANMLTIPKGCMVANLVLAAEREVTFRTDANLVLFPCGAPTVLTSHDGLVYNEVSMPDSRGRQVFSPDPRPGDSFYLVYDHGDGKDLSNHVLSLEISCRHAEGIGVDPTDPPLTWEAYCKNGQWVRLEIARDTTLALNQPGVIELCMPPDLKRLRRQKNENEQWDGYWVRCRYNPSPLKGKFRYSDSPELHGLRSETIGGITRATHAAIIEQEILGYSSGEPGQVFSVAHPPILPPVSEDEVIEVSDEPGQWQAWQERPDFGESLDTDTYVVIDRVGGKVYFGPRIRERDGLTRQLGEVPPRGSVIRYRRYRTGGGSAGNVAAGKLTVMKDAVAYVDRVTNARPATGGRDAETIDSAKLRAPRRLARTRAVTSDDFEFLAKEAAPEQVGRAYCVEPALDDMFDEPPTLTVYIVPAVLGASRLLDIEDDLTPDTDLLELVRSYLHERRLLTSRVQVRAPQFKPLNIAAQLQVRSSTDLAPVRQAALEALTQFLSPFTGGPAGAGWPFDRPPYQWEIEHVLARIPGVVSIVPNTVKVRVGDTPVAEIKPEKGVLFVADDFSDIEFKVA